MSRILGLEILVVGLDPGGTSGLCIWQPGLDPSLREASPPETMDILRAFALGYENTVTFVVENFIITPATAKMSQQTDALELIGVVKYLCQTYDQQYVLQTPSEAKKFSTDAKLKAAGWYSPGLPHARDASRHVLLYAAKNGLFDLARLIGG